MCSAAQSFICQHVIRAEILSEENGNSKNLFFTSSTTVVPLDHNQLNTFDTKPWLKRVASFHRFSVVVRLSENTYFWINNYSYDFTLVVFYISVFFCWKKFIFFFISSFGVWKYVKQIVNHHNDTDTVEVIVALVVGWGEPGRDIHGFWIFVLGWQSAIHLPISTPLLNINYTLKYLTFLTSSLKLQLYGVSTISTQPQQLEIRTEIRTAEKDCL